eukprot:COSAG03_NODE_635_length_6601_cov_165.858197_5_plen_50_part_00
MMLSCGTERVWGRRVRVIIIVYTPAAGRPPSESHTRSWQWTSVAIDLKH